MADHSHLWPVLQDITEMGGGELILSPSTGSAAQPIAIRSMSIPTSHVAGSRCDPLLSEDGCCCSYSNCAVLCTTVSMLLLLLLCCVLAVMCLTCQLLWLAGRNLWTFLGRKQETPLPGGCRFSGAYQPYTSAQPHCL